MDPDRTWRVLTDPEGLRWYRRVLTDPEWSWHILNEPQFMKEPFRIHKAFSMSPNHSGYIQTCKDPSQPFQDPSGPWRIKQYLLGSFRTLQDMSVPLSMWIWKEISESLQFQILTWKKIKPGVLQLPAGALQIKGKWTNWSTLNTWKNLTWSTPVSNI